MSISTKILILRFFTQSFSQKLVILLNQAWVFQTGCNPLSVSPTKWSNTIKQFVGKFPTNYLNMFDHFVGLEF